MGHPDGIAMLADAPCGLLGVDAHGTIIATNERLNSWLGRSADDLNGMPVTQLFSKASRIVFETSIVPLLSLNSQIDGASVDLVNGEGAKLPVLLSAEVHGAGEKSVTTYVFLLADARRAFERDLSAARIKAETLLDTTKKEGELREQFIAILGHDLRNPLASIASAMNILTRETLSDRNQQIVTLTRGSVQRMSLLIDNILDFARNRLGGGIPLKRATNTDVATEIQQVIDELRSAQSHRDIQTNIALDKDIDCDAPRVGQLLSNLLGNAVTYGDQSLPISIHAGTTDTGAFELSVKNYGTPIAPAAMERLFDPFVRSESHGNKQGLGLGLYIASEIAKAHDGTLGVQSNDDHTIFTLTIPQGIAPA